MRGKRSLGLDLFFSVSCCCRFLAVSRVSANLGAGVAVEIMDSPVWSIISFFSVDDMLIDLLKS